VTRPFLRFSSLIGVLLTTSALSTASAQPRANPPPGKAADSSERDQRARDRFEQGRAAYKDGRYRDAWAYFHEAYQLSGRPELLYNIGQTADRLGQDADALKAFNMYLERLPNAENRRDVENRVRALRERVNQPSPPPPARTATPATPVEPTPVAPVAAQHRLARESAPPPPPEKTRRHGARHGLYLRGALGFGYRYDGLSGNEGGSASFDGVGLSFDLGAGYAVLPGFVVGGMLFLDQTFRPTLTASGVDFKLSHANLWTFGPFVDWYPKREAAGWHLQGALGIGVLGYGGKSFESSSASGIDIIVGGGYEWSLSGAYALGVLARFTLGLLSEDEGSHGWVSPNIAVSFTWF
jgi:hypothetical protein